MHSNIWARMLYCIMIAFGAVLIVPCIFAYEMDLSIRMLGIIGLGCVAAGDILICLLDNDDQDDHDDIAI